MQLAPKPSVAEILEAGRQTEARRSMRYTVHVEVANPGGLAAVIAAIEALGHPVECPVFNEWSRLARRDSYLRMAHALMPGPGDWTKSVQLAARVLYFETRIWPRWSHLDEPPAEFSEGDRFLFMARKLGTLPGTDRQLHNIAAKSNPPCDFGEKPVSSAPASERGI